MVDFSIEILAGELKIIARPVGIIVGLQLLAEGPVTVKVPDAAVYVNYLPDTAQLVGTFSVFKERLKFYI